MLTIDCRAGVILVQDGRLALIRRVHPGRVYYLFPGGHLEPDEAPEAAAVREAKEELGLAVQLDRLAAVVQRGEQTQYYYLARALSGRFGSGTGEELSAAVESASGAHQPVWVELDQLDRLPVFPAELAGAIREGSLDGLTSPLHIRD